MSATPIPARFRKFKNKHREFVHIENGWCLRQLSKKSIWRVFYGTVTPGAEYPTYVNAHQEGDRTVDFEHFDDAVTWVERRRLLR